MSDPTPDSIIRENIKKHFNLHKRLEPAIDLYEKMIRQNPDKQKDIYAQQIIKGKYKNLIKSHEELEFVGRAARISIWKEEYNKEKNYMNSIMEQIENGILSCTQVERDYPKFKELIKNQYHILLNIVQPSDEYTYDKYVESLDQKNKKYFTYIEEGLLLESLHLWKKYKKPPCICRVCALMHLTDLALTFAEDTKKTQIIKLWKDNKIDTWLYDFEIRHSKYISEYFLPEEQCNNDPKVASQIPDIRPDKKLESAKDEQPSSSTSVSQTSSRRKETLEPSLKKSRVDSPVNNQFLKETK